MKEILEDEILALVPEYTGEGANFTGALLFNKEKLILKKNIKSSLKMLCAFYHFDLKSANKTSKELLGITKSPPICIRNNLVFICVKTRTPIGKDDGAYSYINTEMIKGVKEGVVVFKDGSDLRVISSAKTIEKEIKHANILKQMIRPRTSKRGVLVREEESPYLEDQLYLEDYEGLRKDLDIIYRKLQRIEKNLFK